MQTKAIATPARMKGIRRPPPAAELLVRKVLRKLKLTYRTRACGLSRTSFIANQSSKWAIFLYGCSSDGHKGCKLSARPKTKTRCSPDRVVANRTRDAGKVRRLRVDGFRVITVWECETRDVTRFERRLARLLVPAGRLEALPNDREFLTSSKRPRSCGGGPPLRVADLFSGCGGLTLGVHEAARLQGRGIEVRLAVESDGDAALTYAANFQPTHGTTRSDVRSWFDSPIGAPLSWAERHTRKIVGRVDVLVGGPPCQGHSTLNNHTRGDDPKNDLYLRMVRAAEVLRPDAILIENVPAVERDAGRTLSKATSRLIQLGYHVDTAVVCVADIGVPQVRRRHVLLAHRQQQPVISAAIAAARVQPRDLEWAIGDLLDIERTEMKDIPGMLTSESTRRVEFLLKHHEYDLPNRQRPACQRGHHKYKSMYGRLHWNQPAQTITTGFGSPGQGRYFHPSQPRTLTAHEAARIQFFPDWFDFSSLRHRTHLARAIGNAVPPKLSFVLVHHLLELAASGTARKASA